jgi:phage baseplate assembly protein W
MAYSDLNQFTPTLNPIVEDEESVYQSLYNLLATRPMERLFRPTFGLNLDSWLFELTDDKAEALIKDHVIRVIEEHEPRVDLDVVNTTVIPFPSENRFDVELVFTLSGSATTQTLRGSLTP